MNNIEAIMKLKGAWDAFKRNHPMFPKFIKAVRKNGITEGTVIDITITYPDGTKHQTNVKVTESDLELYESLKTFGA